MEERKIISAPPPQWFERNRMRPVDWAMHGLGCTICLVLGIIIGIVADRYWLTTPEAPAESYSEDFIPEEVI